MVWGAASVPYHEVFHTMKCVQMRMNVYIGVMYRLLPLPSVQRRKLLPYLIWALLRPGPQAIWYST